MSTVTTSEILAGVVNPSEPNLPPAVARYLIALTFSSAQLDRVDSLSQKASAGKLSEAEASELERYIALDTLITLMRLKAQRSLRPDGV